MASRTFVKIFLFVGLGAALFTAGYFWALRGIDHETSATAKSSDAAGIKGIKNMAGMEGMSGTSSGTVMVSP